MNGEILINVTPMESRVALVENGVVQEIFIERAQSRGLVGNLYLGKVSRVLPGMQAAFVDIGLHRGAFIHANDFIVDVDPIPNIYDLVREGQSILVQVVKDQLGTKGARLTMQYSVPTRYLVFMPLSDHLGVSQRIEDEVERDRLRSIVQQLSLELKIEQGGFIVRTVAEGLGITELRSDMLYLQRLWRVLQQRQRTLSAPALVYEDLPLHLRVARDMVQIDVETIRIDSRETFAKTIEFVQRFNPEVEARFEYYPGERPIFELFGVEDELAKALSRKVDFKSGGYAIFDQTEAMSTIDVNTGGFVGHRNLEETIFKTNLEAVAVIARQLRLRNLGGIIIIDFIDMSDEEHQRQVLRMFEKLLERDHAKTKVTRVSELGLVEMTRERSRESLEHILTGLCPVCVGRGRIKTAQTVCYEIFREILREERAYNSKSYLVLAAQVVIDRLLDEESPAVADLEEFIGKPLRFQVESIYHAEQYDVILL